MNVDLTVTVHQGKHTYVGSNELFRYLFSLQYADITLTDTNRRFICMLGAGKILGEYLDNIP